MITNRIVEILAWPVHYVHLELTYILTYITGKLNITGKQNKIQSIFQLYTWPFPSLSCPNSYIRLEGWVGVWGMWQALDGPGDGKGRSFVEGRMGLSDSNWCEYSDRKDRAVTIWCRTRPTHDQEAAATEPAPLMGEPWPPRVGANGHQQVWGRCRGLLPSHIFSALLVTFLSLTSTYLAFLFPACT